MSASPEGVVELILRGFAPAPPSALKDTKETTNQHKGQDEMKIHAIQTGTVQVKQSFLYPGRGPRRQLGLFMPGAWSEPLPIYCWAIEHDGVLRLVDTGETAAAQDVCSRA